MLVSQCSASRSGQLGVYGLLLPVLWTVGLWHRWHPSTVSDGGIHRPLAGAHVAEGGVHVGALTSCMAVVRVGTILVV